jgi:hypothetical protein
MKTINILGKNIPILIVALIILAISASAVLVSYLSNRVEADVTVQSPMSMRIGTVEGDLGTGTILLDLVEGGETVSFFMQTDTLANVPITGRLENLITNPVGITCADFSDIRGRVKTNGGDWSDWNIFDLTPIAGSMPDYDVGGAFKCYEVDANTIQLSFTPTSPWTWPAAPYEDVIEVSATFMPAALGSYTLTSEIKV